VWTREQNITQLDVLIIGPRDTPYQGGFFHFYLKFGTDYPMKPPRVKFMTTDSGKVRFNPNLYNCGKVCLSLLGTWQGPPWTAAQTLSSLLISIQSLMTENPISNEPAWEKEKPTSKRALAYSAMIAHETLRVAVCNVLSKETTLPTAFMPVVKEEFLSNYEWYSGLAETGKEKDKDNTVFSDCLDNRQGTFGYSSLINRMSTYKCRLEAEPAEKGDGDGEGAVLGRRTSRRFHDSGAKHAGVNLLTPEGNIAKASDDDEWDLNDDDEDVDEYEEEEDAEEI